ncbi:Mitogen-activated protein kinase kinase kinase A [Morella rubra]|uniref:Mitogen-activated protein kinase kinase kinase A n=1 Tax=Morella rubra TaxID=262757 RepID=A0A6A1UID3_9ROSI|nr:Mitogen-activated protein kinase kinase kinase A [Morella rubra]
MEKVEVYSNMISWVRGKCIGKGSFGTVTLGVDVQDRRVFAVKSVDRDSGLMGHLEALENEIEILRSISSPYVVGFLGDDVTYESPTTSYRNLHLEYLPGGTVVDVARPKGSDVDERIVRSRAWCVVSALRYLHSRGIVHCDVKGRNILVGPDTRSAKLADFGSAIKTSGENCAAPIMPRGSPLWMAPEVIRRESQGAASDVWSLGCTIIEMITGKPAWEDRGLDTLSRIGFSDELPEFPTFLSELGLDFLDKCLRRDPCKRWSCDQLLQHPFLSSSSSPNKVTDSSPRCVLDWFNAEFDAEDQDDEENGLSSENCEASARERIGKLATKTGVNWESDGWLAVRALACGAEAAGASCCGDEGEKPSTEYPVLTRTEGEKSGTSSEYSDSARATEESERRTRLEYGNSGGGLLLSWRYNNNYSDCVLWWGGCSCKAGSTCRHGSQKADFALGCQKTSIYSCCTSCFHHYCSHFILQ